MISLKLILATLAAFPAWTGVAYQDQASKPRDVAKESRGYIGCENGEWVVRNLTLNTHNVEVPPGEYVIRLRKEWCKK